MPGQRNLSAVQEHNLSEADRARFADLFKKLDVNGDGRIDIHDLSEALHRLEVPQLPDHAQVCFCSVYENSEFQKQCLT